MLANAPVTLLVALACSVAVSPAPVGWPTGDTAAPWPTREVSRPDPLPFTPGTALPIGPNGVFRSGFGPRRVEEDGGMRDDFHLGVDYVAPIGEPALAVADGTCFAVRPSESESDGNTLYLEHALPKPFWWLGVRVERYYVVYSHLSGFACDEGEPVGVGQVVAFTGDTGVVHEPHLHVEVRLGTHCSLRYQTEHPGSGCATGFDPAVHPFHFWRGAQPGGLSLEVLSEDPFLVRVATPSDDQDLDRLSSSAGVIDFDRREGLDARTFEALDDFDWAPFRLEPQPWEHDDPERVWHVAFPERPGWFEVVDLHGDGLRLPVDQASNARSGSTP